MRKIMGQKRWALLWEPIPTTVKNSVSDPEPDPDPHGSALRWPPWIRIRIWIRIRDADSGSGSRGFKITEK